MLKDPVCGKQVSEDTPHKTEYHGSEYGFCSEHCEQAFENSPEAFLEQGRTAAPQARKVCVIGTGHVGSAFAFALMEDGVAEDIVLISRSQEKVRAQVMDLNHGLMFVPPQRIRGGDYEDCKDADMVVVTAGAAQEEGETRIDLARRNTDIFRKIIPRIAEQNPHTIMVVTNPVDVLTYAAIKISGMPPGSVLGSGTVLDTARFRYLLSNHCGVAPQNVHGYILGEHGDSEVPIWSKVQIGNVPIQEYCRSYAESCPSGNLDAVFRQVKNAAYEIIAGKGATEYGIALAMVRIVRAVLRDENSILTVTTLVDGPYGIEDVCLSAPCLVNRKGAGKVLEIDMSDEELKKYRASADFLKDVQRQVGF